MDLAKMTLEVAQHVDIKRGMAEVFEGAVKMLSENMKYPDGKSMDAKLELRPGGRWYRDFGNDTGHLWGFVQTYKPPVLLELTGPFFMSYPVLNYVEVKLSEVEGGTRLSLRHRALGLLEDNALGVTEGWGKLLSGIKQELEG